MAVGFIGTGTMGVPIARHLLRAGHALRVFDLAPGATQSLVDAGAQKAESIGSLARSSRTLFLSLPGPTEIRAVVDAVLPAMSADTLIIDLSTNSVDCARTLATRVAGQGGEFIDAPVSGGVVGAERGTLSVMVGATQAGFDRAKPLIESFAKAVIHVGEAGSGTLAKLVNNQIFLCASVLIQEGFVLGAKAGMDAQTLKAILDVSSAGLYTRKADFVLSRDFDKAVFKLGIAAKDVGVALESAASLGVDMPMTSAAHAIYRDAVEHGFGAEVFSATLKVLEGRADVAVARLEPKP